ncbi:Uncharacterised protein [Mycobacteroides abscessus]|nr:Uncharacterised protein [Mycobacteroides abscessus]
MISVMTVAMNWTGVMNKIVAMSGNVGNMNSNANALNWIDVNRNYNIAIGSRIVKDS